ncbi:AbrB/MazE/SpoVT family DNA-binding domain-containing protein [Amycolatopsis aidingensis]|uniref:AbrB/MazE/SpoVT family DNA-binding domain-containing protein n=1 Tax=Amycolatopsis aidingensis TaxID=2842453 RepID=UPI001C0C3ED1|nr:AbrB/MazE/SpoVT family DNA-binding domain-containing protein [Amycolatopsis aidingensis]
MSRGTSRSAAPQGAVATTVADHIVTALVPSRKTARGHDPARSLPLPVLHNSAHDGSMVYDIARVDASGRVPARDVLRHLGWNPGDSLGLTLVADTIVLTADVGGFAAVSRQYCVVIPAMVRARCGISIAHKLLLAAAVHHRVLLAYTMSKLDKIMNYYHTASTAGKVS